MSQGIRADGERLQNEPYTLAFYIDGLTGRNFGKLPPHEVLTNGMTEDVLVLRGSSNPTLILRDKDGVSGKYKRTGV